MCCFIEMFAFLLTIQECALPQTVANIGCLQDMAQCCLVQPFPHSVFSVEVCWSTEEKTGPPLEVQDRAGGPVSVTLSLQSSPFSVLGTSPSKLPAGILCKKRLKSALNLTI